MKRTTAWFMLVLALAMVASACAGDDSGDDEETTTTTTEAPAESTTTTTRAPDPGFEGLVLDAGGCDYGGRVEKITATDEFTVEFDLCGPHPAFLSQIAFSVFGIQPQEHLEATGGAPLDNPSVPARTRSSSGSAATRSCCEERQLLRHRRATPDARSQVGHGERWDGSSSSRAETQTE
jgi:hypothetical protein